MKTVFRPAPIRRRTVLSAAIASLSTTLPISPSITEAAEPGSKAALDPVRLSRAMDRAARLDQIHSLVIGRHGQVVAAKAFRGPPPDRVVNIKSVSKTIIATLVGTALDRGVLRDTDWPLTSAAPGLIPPGADPRVHAITIAQLLTMQAGLEPTSGPEYGRWIESRNWVSYALSRPFVAEPGERMIYSTGSYHVLGAVLARLTGRSLLSLAREWLGELLDIDVPAWTRDPQGFYLGGNNMLLSPLALFRFGEMWQGGGVWKGRRVVSTAWITKSWTPRTRSPFSGDAYGYGWFLAEANGRQVVYARGYGGQMLYLVPSLGLTVVVTSDVDRPARSHGYVGVLHALLTEDVIPAAEAT